MATPNLASLNAARQLIAAGRLDEADLLIDDALTLAPDHIDALVLKGSSLFARRQVDGAFALFSELAMRHPDRADVVANLGAVHRMQGRAEEARLCFEQAVALAPDDGNYRASLATALLLLKQFDAARAEAGRLLDVASRQENPEFAAEAQGLIGRIAYMQGRFAAAEKALRQALSVRPGHPADLSVLSTVLSRLEKREEALALAEQAYLDAPADHDRTVSLARRLAEMNRIEEAERHLRRVVAIAPLHVDAHHFLAQLSILKGGGATALAGVAGLVRRAPADPDLLLRMAGLVRLGGELDKALVFAQQAVKLAPQSTDARAVRDEILLALGRVEEVWPEREDSAALVLTEPLFVPEGLPAADVMLFARYAQRLAPQGARIPCHAEPALLPLLEGIVGLAPQPLPAPPEAVPITILPSYFGLRGPEGGAYLAVEAERHERWGEALSRFPRPLIGIVWDDAPPGLTLEPLKAALLEGMQGEGTLVSLAFGRNRGALAGHDDIIDAGAHFSDTRDLVAATAWLDMTIGADGLALHIAGALGRKGVVAVPALQPWMWAQKDGTSLWYPSIRVVRQPTPGSWVSTLAELAAAAREVADDGAAAAIEPPSRLAPA